MKVGDMIAKRDNSAVPEDYQFSGFIVDSGKDDCGYFCWVVLWDNGSIDNLDEYAANEYWVTNDADFW